MPFADTLRLGLTAAALTAPPGAQAQPPPTPAPQTPATQDARPWLPVKSTPQAAPPIPPTAPPAVPQYPQPPAAPAPPPARDVPPPIPPPPPAAGLGQADETTSTTTTTTTRKSGGIIISNNAAGATNQIAVGNYGAGWGSPAPASFARPARDFATPPDDGGSGSVAVTGYRYRDRDVPLAQAQRIDLERPGALRRLGYYLCPKERFLATPRAAVPTGLSIAVQPVAVAVPVPAAPAVPVASPQYAPAPVFAAPAAPRKSCLPWLLGR